MVRFYKIVEVKSAGRGNNYVVYSSPTLFGIVYYRLIQEDYNGQKTLYSPIYLYVSEEPAIEYFNILGQRTNVPGFIRHK